MFNIFDFAIAIIILVLILWYFGIVNFTPSMFLPKSMREGLTCGGCDGYKLPSQGLTVINPFIWPYSATGCTDVLYELDRGSNIDFGFPPLGQAQNTQDHVPKTN